MKKTALFLAVALALAACSNKDEPASPKAAAAAADIPLSFAPVNSAFALGNFEPAPQSYIDAISPMLDTMKTGFVQSLDRAKEVAADEAPEQELAKINALIDLFKERLQKPDTLASMGIKLNGLQAAYEVSGAPVLRLELADPALFKTFVAEVETRAGEKLPTAELNGQAYWHLPLGDKAAEASAAIKPRLVAAIIGKQLVVAFDPQIAELPLAQLIGLERPAKSFVDGGELQAINKQYGYQNYGTNGVVDLRRIVSLFAPAEGSTTWLSKAAQESGNTPSAVCRTEFLSIADKAPRFVLGAKEITGKKFDMGGVLEVESKIAGELKKITAPVPGLGTDKTGVEFGMSLKVDQLAGFLQAQAAAVQAAPYQCEQLQPLNQQMAELTQNLAGLYAASGWLTGARASLSEFDIENQIVKGTVVLASPNPMGLIGMAQGFLPELGQLGLTPDGKAKELQSPMVAGTMGPDSQVWVAMNDKAIGLGIGAGTQSAVESAIKASPANPEPLLYYGFSGESYLKMTGGLNEDALAQSADSDAEAMANYIMWPVLQSAINFYKSVDFVSMSYLLTDRGVEMNQTMTLK